MKNTLPHSPYNIPVINNLRGIAALMVCLYHFVSQTKNYIQSDKIRDAFSYGDHGVQMFFIISGVVIPLSMVKGKYDYSSWGRFVLKRFIRLEPSFLVALGIALVYFQIRKYVPGTSSEDMMISGKEILLHIGYLIPFSTEADWAVPSFWTLAIEFQYYLLLSLIFPFALKSINWRLLFYLVFLLLPYLIHSGAFFPLHATLFLVGIVYAFWLTGKIREREYFIVTLLAIGVALSTIKITQVAVGVVTLMIIHFAANIQTRVLSFLGAVSYSLYLTHQTTGTPVINFLSHRFRDDYHKPLVIIVGLLVAVICAYVLYRLVELPSLRWSKQIRYGD